MAHAGKSRKGTVRRAAKSVKSGRGEKGTARKRAGTRTRPVSSLLAKKGKRGAGTGKTWSGRGAGASKKTGGCGAAHAEDTRPRRVPKGKTSHKKGRHGHHGAVQEARVRRGLGANASGTGGVIENVLRAAPKFPEGSHLVTVGDLKRRYAKAQNPGVLGRDDTRVVRDTPTEVSGPYVPQTLQAIHAVPAAAQPMTPPAVMPGLMDVLREHGGAPGTFRGK